MKKSILMLAVFGTLTGCAGLDVAWELHATYLTKDLQDKRAAALAADPARQVEADRAAAALIQARNEAAVK